MKDIQTIGIIGLGGFGAFAVTIIPRRPGMQILGFDADRTKQVPGVEPASFEQVAAADVVVLAVPLEAYETVLPRLAALLKSDTLVIDICSVKVRPTELFRQFLPMHRNVLLTHPLFGPQSAGPGKTAGHKLVVTGSKGDRAKRVLERCKSELKLEICRMAAPEHDKIMAQVHALTFFVARGLSELNMDAGPFITPSYRMILDLIKLDRTHSDQLFQTIQRGNPYADAIRQQVLRSFNDVESELSREPSE